MRLIEDDFTPTEAVIGKKVVWVVPYKDIYEAPTVDAIPVEWIKNYINRTNDTDGYAVAEMLSEWEEDDEQPSSDACDQISEIVMERLKAEKILEQLGQNLGEVFGKIAETIDDYCNEILKEEGKKNG